MILFTLYSIHLLMHSLKDLLLLIRFSYKEFVLLLVPHFSAFIRLLKLPQYFLFPFPQTLNINFQLMHVSIQMTSDMGKVTRGEVYVACPTVPGTCLILIDLLIEPIDDFIALLSPANNLLCHF